MDYFTCMYHVFPSWNRHLTMVEGGVWVRRVRLLVEHRIQVEQCGFRPGRGTLDQLYTLARVLEGAWVNLESSF